MSFGGEKHLVLGLIGHNKKYLTQEKFGMKVNAMGRSMQVKQRWTVEQPGGDDYVLLRSHLDRYLSADAKGNIRCDAEAAGENERFTVETQNDGRWAIRSSAYGCYFGGTDDMLSCRSKTIGNTELWTAQMCIHPQVHLKNVARKRYVKLQEGELRITDDIPWGNESVITLGFEDGKHTLQAYDGTYLRGDGKMVEESSQDTRFNLELRGGKVTFRDHEGRYLSPFGPRAILQRRNKTLGKDDFFVLEESVAQGAFLAHNGKYVSYKQGEDLSANQRGNPGNLETFQLEYDDDNGKWAVRAAVDKYWSLTQTSGIQLTTMNQITPEALFSIEYGDRCLAMMANNGKYITAKPNGHLYATCESISEKTNLKFQLMNRNALVLRGQYGFVGVKPTSATNKLECNCSKYSLVHLTYRDGTYQVRVKGSDGNFLSLGKDGSLSTDGTEPCEFTLEFHKGNKVCLRAPNGNLVKGEQHGTISATGDKVELKTLWEF
ncbi:fascin-like [Ptychodera flava]|uniref:fascin-like n=1 Tax=Ptychodera flava TaxID=63121 RepID=UPI003969F1BF